MGAMLAALLGGSKPVRAAEITGRLDAKEKADLDVDFEVDDALAKLVRLRVVERPTPDRYAAAPLETALQRLSAAEREAIIARVELGLSYQEMATYLSKPSPDEARMAVTRAIVRLTEEMARG